MISPLRAYRRWRLRNIGRMYVPLPYRPLFTGDTYPPAPPTPAMLREAAAALDALPAKSREYQDVVFATIDGASTGTAQWLREIADLLPEPYRVYEYLVADRGGSYALAWPEQPSDHLAAAEDARRWPQ